MFISSLANHFPSLPPTHPVVQQVFARAEDKSSGFPGAYLLVAETVVNMWISKHCSQNVLKREGERGGRVTGVQGAASESEIREGLFEAVAFGLRPKREEG